jgi:uncharacterized heparinase superfamily protein
MVETLQHFDAHITLPDFEVSPVRAHLMQSALHLSPYRWMLKRGGAQDVVCFPPDLWSGDPEEGQTLIDGVYTLRGQAFPVTETPWRRGGLPLEASHFLWLRDLHAVGGDQARQVARRLTESWIREHGCLSGLPWQPYSAAERAVLWLQHYSFFAAGSEEDFQEALSQSLVLHLYRLRAHYYARYPDDDPLLIIKGMMYITGCLKGYEAWFETLESCLEDYLSRTIDERYEHRCKSLSLQLETVIHLLDIRLLYQSKKQRAPLYLKDMLCQMAAILKRAQMGTGTLPAFHATPRYDRAWLQSLLTMAGQSCQVLVQPYQGRVMGLEKVVCKNTCVIMDCRLPDMGQRYHASPLAFELSLGKNLLITNCGYSAMLSPEWKKGLRSTAAHSTLSMDDADAFDYGLSGEKTLSRIETEVSEDAGRITLKARHDGYFGRFGVLHERTLVLSRNGDHLSGHDGLKGAQGHAFCVRFHLPPHIRPLLEAGKNRVYLDAVNQDIWTLTCLGLPIALEESVFIDAEGNSRPTSQVVIRGTTGAGQTDIHWVLQKA